MAVWRCNSGRHNQHTLQVGHLLALGAHPLHMAEWPHGWKRTSVGLSHRKHSSPPPTHNSNEKCILKVMPCSQALLYVLQARKTGYSHITHSAEPESHLYININHSIWTFWLSSALNSCRRCRISGCLGLVRCGSDCWDDGRRWSWVLAFLGIKHQFSITILCTE